MHSSLARMRGRLIKDLMGMDKLVPVLLACREDPSSGAGGSTWVECGTRPQGPGWVCAQKRAPPPLVRGHVGEERKDTLRILHAGPPAQMSRYITPLVRANGCCKLQLRRACPPAFNVEQG